MPGELIAAFLWAQLENIDLIQNKRLALWHHYCKSLIKSKHKGFFGLPETPAYATQNGHMFYLVCSDIIQRRNLISHLKSEGILAVFHYLSLHKSEYYKSKHDGRELPFSDKFTDHLLRLPMYYELSIADVQWITQTIETFYEK